MMLTTSARAALTASLLALTAAWPALAQETTTEEVADEAAEETAAEAGTEAGAEAGTEAATDASAETTEAEASGDAATSDAATSDEATGDAATEAPTAEAAPMTVPTRDTVIATVNGVDITFGQVIIAAARLPEQYRQLPPPILMQGVVDQLVQQELLAQSMTTVPTRVDLALEVERRSLLAGEAVNAMFADGITDEQVQAAYDEQVAAMEPVQEWNAAHILVASEDEAKAVVERLDAGEDFAALAQELSTDTGSGANGGDLGWFGPGMMVPEFEAGVATLEAGAVSAPIQSQFGWHVIRLNEVREQAKPTLDELRPQITAQLQEAAIQAKLAELEGAGTVERTDITTLDPAALMDLSLIED